MSSDNEDLGNKDYKRMFSLGKAVVYSVSSGITILGTVFGLLLFQDRKAMKEEYEQKGLKQIDIEHRSALKP